MTARRKPAQVGNVVALRKQVETTEEIIASVRKRSRAQTGVFAARMQETLALLQERHRRHAQDQLLPIAYAMPRVTLDDWIEIGRRMLGGKA
jgi:hypothetical protein